MRYDKAFFGLQLEFAEKVSGLSGMPLALALLHYTNLYIRFGLGRDFDQAHPKWREYLAGLETASDREDWTYRFYAALPELPPPDVVATFGCFSYAWLSGDRIRIHFHNAEPDGRSPLGGERRHRRSEELAAMFASLKQSAQPSVHVVGASWLYNLDAYRRLFPASYLATANVMRHPFRYMPLWGQFVNRLGEIRENLARHFRERLAKHSALQDLERCFPFQALYLEAPVAEFHEFFGI
jgi:hypothetical protein